jgi:hypothetical protein
MDKGRNTANNGSLNTSQTYKEPPVDQKQVRTLPTFEDDGKWKCAFTKEQA